MGPLAAEPGDADMDELAAFASSIPMDDLA